MERIEGGALRNFDKCKAAKIADGLKGQNLNDQLKNWHTLMAQPKINFGKLVDATVAIEKTIELYKSFLDTVENTGSPLHQVLNAIKAEMAHQLSKIQFS